MKWARNYFRAVRERLYAWLVPPYCTQVVDGELPKKLHEHILYIVQDDGFTDQAAMICPCGCKRTLHLNLLSDERPCWRVTRHGDGTATIHPSVWRKKGCRSHFWFRRGRVVWCNTQTGIDQSVTILRL